MTRRGSHHGAGSFLPNQTPDRFKQATYFTNILLAKIGLTIDFVAHVLRVAQRATAEKLDLGGGRFARGFLALVLFEIAFAQTDRFGCQFHEFVFSDELNGGFQR